MKEKKRKTSSSYTHHMKSSKNNYLVQFNFVKIFWLKMNGITKIFKIKTEPNRNFKFI